MKMILCLEAASDSGRRGFSEACPLRYQSSQQKYRALEGRTTYHPAQTAWTPARSATSTMTSTLA